MQRNSVPSCRTGNGEGSLGEFGRVLGMEKAWRRNRQWDIVVAG